MLPKSTSIYIYIVISIYTDQIFSMMIFKSWLTSKLSFPQPLYADWMSKTKRAKSFIANVCWSQKRNYMNNIVGVKLLLVFGYSVHAVHLTFMLIVFVFTKLFHSSLKMDSLITKVRISHGYDIQYLWIVKLDPYNRTTLKIIQVVDK